MSIEIGLISPDACVFESGVRGVGVVSECSKRLSQGQKQLTLLNSATPSLTKYPLIFLSSHPPRVDFSDEASQYNSISLFSPPLSLSRLVWRANTLKSKYMHTYYIHGVHY